MRWGIIWIAILVVPLQRAAFSIVQPKTRSCPVPEEIKDKKYQPGQVWQYKTRPQEEGSRVTVLKVEKLPRMGTIVHVRVDDIRLRNCRRGPEPNGFQHMPFSRDAMEQSVIKLEKDNAAVGDLGGYEQWRADCGGVYTITVAEAIDVAETTFNKGLGCRVPDHNSSPGLP